MRVLEIKSIPYRYAEVTLERRLLFWKRNATYRKVGHIIYRYKGGGNYGLLGVFGQASINEYFNLTKSII